MAPRNYDDVSFVRPSYKNPYWSRHGKKWKEEKVLILEPLIKWAGGKSNEIVQIEKLIPHNSFDRFIEPFFGGGAVFFHLEPKGAIINDKSRELMLIYEFLSEGRHREAFKIELFEYVKNWERINVYMKIFGDLLLQLYNGYKVNAIGDYELEKEVQNLFEQNITEFNGMFDNKFCVDVENLQKTIQESVVAKLKRTKIKVDPENKFSEQSIKHNIETAFRSGFYVHFRHMMNQARLGTIKLSDEKKVANYYFIREFCYGGMFRFNASGEFNVPYGGMNYNRKNFRKKVDYLFSDKVRDLLRTAQKESMDFEELFKKYPPTEKDFIFLDPPYDTEFSEYEENPFTKSDQIRLAEFLSGTPAKFILVIKETNFIHQLYSDRTKFNVLSFGKTYSYNIKSRFERSVNHLVIHNMDITGKQFNPV